MNIIIYVSLYDYRSSLQERTIEKNKKSTNIYIFIFKIAPFPPQRFDHFTCFPRVWQAFASKAHYHFLHFLKQNEEYFKFHMLKIINTVASYLLNSWISSVRLLLPYWFLQLYIMDINALFYSENSFYCLLTLPKS